jgi:predicted transcriptional regulator
MIKEARGTLDIISYLHRNQEACLTELVDNVDASQKTVYRAIDILLGLDLISEEKRIAFPMKRVFTLTSKGRQVALAPVYKWNGVLNSFGHPRFHKKTSKFKGR